MGKDPDVASQLLAAVQVEKAMRMRMKGAHWREVSDVCGYSSPAAALKAVGAAMKEASLRADQTADEMRTEAVMRLESLLGSAIEMIEKEEYFGQKGEELDDRPHRLKAVDTARRIIADVSKLNGLDKPVEDVSDAPTIRVIGIDLGDVV